MNNANYAMEDLLPLIEEVVASGGEFRLYPRGTSMRPLLREGRDSVALVAPDGFSRGDICLYRRKNGTFVLHRLERIERDETLSFRGDNQSRIERGIREDALIARVAAVYRDEKRISLTSLRYRSYCFFRLKHPFRTLRFLIRDAKVRLRAILKKR